MITRLIRAQSEQLNWSNINFPMKLTDISKCEKQNENIAVNVLGYERDFIHWGSAKRKKRTYINVLLISDIHYCLINRLLPNQTSKDEKAKKYFLRCLNHFSSKEKLALHVVQRARMTMLLASSLNYLKTSRRFLENSTSIRRWS